MDTYEEQRFIVITDDVGAVNAGVTAQVNLESIKTEFGHNFNTLLVTNNSDEEFSLTIDGRKMFYVKVASALSLDWRDGIIFDHLQLTNESVSNSSANELRISVGRTGPSSDVEKI